MPESAVDVYISVGSNIEPEANLQLACRGLASRYGELTLSSVYRCEAVGFEGDDFLNMVVGFSTTEEPAEIVKYLEQLHVEAKRVRLENPFSPRSLDLDLLLYGDLIRPAQKLPHDDIEKYGFVLGPLAEILPDLCHPVTGISMRDAWEGFDKSLHPMEKKPWKKSA